MRTSACKVKYEHPYCKCKLGMATGRVEARFCMPQTQIRMHNFYPNPTRPPEKKKQFDGVVGSDEKRWGRRSEKLIHL